MFNVTRLNFISIYFILHMCFFFSFFYQCTPIDINSLKNVIKNHDRRGYKNWKHDKKMIHMKLSFVLLFAPLRESRPEVQYFYSNQSHRSPGLTSAGMLNIILLQPYPYCGLNEILITISSTWNDTFLCVKKSLIILIHSPVRK